MSVGDQIVRRAIHTYQNTQILETVVQVLVFHVPFVRICSNDRTYAIILSCLRLWLNAYSIFQRNCPFHISNSMLRTT